jgi:hypothetical protein
LHERSSIQKQEEDCSGGRGMARRLRTSCTITSTSTMA